MASFLASLKIKCYNETHFIIDMNKRSKTKSSKFRVARTDTHIGTIEKKYNIDLGVRSDMKLSTYLEKQGFDSLSKMLKGEK